jgi:hypothetical protein
MIRKIALLRTWVAAPAALVALAIPALAADRSSRPEPSAQALTRLQARIPSGEVARVVVAGEARLLLSPVFSSDGVRGASQDSARIEPTLIHWSEIDRIEKRGSSRRRAGFVGALMGTAAGAVAGLVITEGSGEGLFGEYGVIVLATVGGASGAIVGSMAGTLVPGWVEVYPETEPPPGSAWGLGRRK